MEIKTSMSPNMMLPLVKLEVLLLRLLTGLMLTWRLARAARCTSSIPDATRSYAVYQTGASRRWPVRAVAVFLVTAAPPSRPGSTGPWTRWPTAPVTC